MTELIVVLICCTNSRLLLLDTSHSVYCPAYIRRRLMRQLIVIIPLFSALHSTPSKWPTPRDAGLYWVDLRHSNVFDSSAVIDELVYTFKPLGLRTRDVTYVRVIMQANRCLYKQLHIWIFGTQTVLHRLSSGCNLTTYIKLMWMCLTLITPSDLFYE